jgi:hypothetical protein
MGHIVPTLAACVSVRNHWWYVLGIGVRVAADP